MYNSVEFLLNPLTGNIARGFIGEVLYKNGVEVVFVDIDKEVIDALNERQAYEIELAAPESERIAVANVRGVNNQTDPELVAKEIVDADIITTAIGPNILPFIAPLIVDGLKLRLAEKNHAPIDVIACENMIGGSEILKGYVAKDLTADEMAKLDEFVGYPNAAVDRIIPGQSHEDPLFVSVEPFSEWVVDASQMKNVNLKLDGVHYDDPADEESVRLQKMLKEKPVTDVIQEVTGIEDETLIQTIKRAIKKY